MAKKESKSKVWLVSLIIALLIFFAGFFLGIKYHTWFVGLSIKLANFLVWFIPLLLILFIVFLVIKHKIKRNNEEKEKAAAAEQEAAK